MEDTFFWFGLNNMRSLCRFDATTFCFRISNTRDSTENFVEHTKPFLSFAFTHFNWYRFCLLDEVWSIASNARKVVSPTKWRKTPTSQRDIMCVINKYNENTFFSGRWMWTMKKVAKRKRKNNTKSTKLQNWNGEKITTEFGETYISINLELISHDTTVAGCTHDMSTCWG